ASGGLVGRGPRPGVERGYHLRFDGEEARLTRPVGWAEGGFYATPMAGHLRVAGTVELDRWDAPPTPARLDYVAAGAARMVGDLPAPSAAWVGARPSMPDAKPVIGALRPGGRVLAAYGHQHLGLTLAGVTGRMVVDAVQGRAAEPGGEAHSPARFVRR
ncbi:FAD-dependent oxidoreductase, partial [Roseobacter sp. HKCCA0434]|uniref:NAD(P)/FAD-dependent oxidoreductase n=1 Tax=Roseobacter sp. HKCCA0434 TaxID=3079297 RepID=UPI002905D5CA